jgi:hypoxanthine phosphoribosyltransferase
VVEPASLLVEPAEVRRRVDDLGRAIARDHAGRDPLLVAVLKGSSVFLADLIRAIDVPLAIDFMAISRFGGAAESEGRVRILKDLETDIAGRDVILVEDIVDTGLTLAYLRSVLASRHPTGLEVCALLDKSVRRIVPSDLRYVGFDCPDVFVVGYGLDLGERHRNLPGLVAVHDLEAVGADPGLLDPFLPGTGGGEVAGLRAPA